MQLDDLDLGEGAVLGIVRARQAQHARDLAHRQVTGRRNVALAALAALIGERTEVNGLRLGVGEQGFDEVDRAVCDHVCPWPASVLLTPTPGTYARRKPVIECLGKKTAVGTGFPRRPC